MTENTGVIIKRVGEDSKLPDLGQGPLGYEGVNHVNRVVEIVQESADKPLQVLNLWGKTTANLDVLETEIDKILHSSGEEKAKLVQEFEEKTGQKVNF